MKTWIISIWSVVSLFSVVFLFLPAGKTKKVIKSVSAILITLIIVKPIFLGEINNILNFNDDFPSLQTSFIIHGDKTRIENTERNLENKLSENGIKGVTVNIAYINDNNYNVIIKNVLINLSKSGIKNDYKNKDIIEKIINLITNELSVKREAIMFCE